MIQQAIILIVALLGAVIVAQAQPAPHVHRIGILAHDMPPPGLLDTFREGLRELGYVEGKNLTIALWNAEGKNERLRALVDELLRFKVDVILTVNTPAAQAAKQATATIPIVLVRVADPVKSGLVPSLAHPGGNVTGLSFLPDELAAKRLQLLTELMPGLARVAVLFNADNLGGTVIMEEMERASAQLGLQVLRLPV